MTSYMGPSKNDITLFTGTEIEVQPSKMTMMEFFGCTFIAFGPPFGLFVFTIMHDPLRIIVLIAR